MSEPESPDDPSPDSPDEAEASSDVQMNWCLSCQADYIASVTECPACEVPLQTGPRFTTEQVAVDGEDQVAYECHEWSHESRVMFESLLQTAAIRHAWHGTTVMVLEVDEEEVDAMAEEVEAATVPQLSPEAEKVGYETTDWSDEHQTDVLMTLTQAGIPHEIDAEGDLVVHEADEDRVEAILDEVEAEIDLDEAGEEVDGMVAHETLGALFISSDRLRKNAADPDAVINFAKATESVSRMRLPYGFERAVWRSIGAQATQLQGVLAGDILPADLAAEADEVVESDETDSGLLPDLADTELPKDELIADLAMKLRDTLRPLV